MWLLPRALALAIAALLVAGAVALARPSGATGTRVPTAESAPVRASPQQALALPPVDYDLLWHRDAEATFASGIDRSLWDLYSGSSANPMETRAPSYAQTSDGVAQLSTAGPVGSGMCWCGPRPRHLYGRWEVRERVTPGAGHGAATLLWPADNDWPDHGEIDLAEMNDPSRSVASSTVHYSGANRQVRTTTAGDFTQWHTFAVEWEPTDVRMWIDGQLTFQLTDPQKIPHTPMYLAVQAGPNTPHPPATSSMLQVAWVKVFDP